MQLGTGGNFELKNNKKEPNIALANNEKKLNLYAKQSYHIQGLSQSKYGFWLSVVGAIVGFIIIVISLFLLIYGKAESMIALAAGTIMESVSILFFSISNKASERVSNSFDKLRVDSNIVHSIDLAKTIDDCSIRDEVKAKLALYLIGINEQNICNQIRTICNSKVKVNKFKEVREVDSEVATEVDDIHEK